MWLQVWRYSELLGLRITVVVNEGHGGACDTGRGEAWAQVADR